ncbi:hypothetical protein GGTG_05083 [Gaeumannomyces tritici R3-111a-1]|uniref:Major facilitator superfamily (MFS) profile domain-containing protein n=1 Tax=Gaeumannomyces tritici (strain R3-111a-1) TaxID=644352 RepID=J3NUX4_GAET3|nr:hypothetical protein GGTG_05083 [Gaeumannomyces tritici R3-111a-1]EJT75146.1 hypothetical protein GGTG_05083 [Gaeumannomyces tritici R3-111a-1]
MVVYVGSLAAGSSLGPIISGAAASGLNSWRAHLWILSGASFFNLVGPAMSREVGTEVIAAREIVVAALYAQSPLLWSPRSIGLINVAPLIDLAIGLPLGGAPADMLNNRSARKANGVHDPSARLPAVLIGGLVSPAGCVVMGFARQRPDKWIKVCVGRAMLSFGLTASANVLLTYSAHCMPNRAGHIGVVVNVAKNCVGFGVSSASLKWLAMAGPVRQFGAMSGILFAVYLLVIPLWASKGGRVSRLSDVLEKKLFFCDSASLRLGWSTGYYRSVGRDTLS